MPIPIPAQLKHLKFNRGLPVPYIVFWDGNLPAFKVNDNIKVERCITRKLCTVCGKPLNKDMWLIGGAVSAFHPRGAFNDAPVHKVCGIYSLQVCPYLAYTSYKAKGLIKPLKTPALMVNQTQTDERLPFFCFVKIKGYTVSRPNPFNRFIAPVKPYLEIEYWKDGRLATPEETEDYLSKALIDP